jgi:hypothetical protein
LLEDFGFHLGGLIEQASVLVRHRPSLQRAASVRLGLTSWRALEIERLRIELAALQRGDGPLRTWLKDRAPDTYANPNVRALDFLAGRLNARGVKLVVVETQMQPTISLIVGDARIEACRARVRAVAAVRGFTFLAAADLPALRDGDFEDHLHMNARGRRIVTESMASRLREIL